MIQGSVEWIEWRKSGVGASDVAAVLGICPYKTRYQLWLEKTGRSKGFEGNSFTIHGQDTEAKARARYELLTMEDMPPACATHPKFSVCLASLDGRKDDNSLILEIKCPRGSEMIAAAKDGKILEHYIPQVQFQLAITGADLLHFFVYHSETQEDALVEVKPDVEYQGKIIAEVLSFWELVKSDTAPPLTDRDVLIVETEEMIELCKKLSSLKSCEEFGQKNAIKKVADKLKEKVIELGGHNKVRCGDVLVSKSVTKTGKDSYRLTIAQPDSETVA